MRDSMGQWENCIAALCTSRERFGRVNSGETFNEAVALELKLYIHPFTNQYVGKTVQNHMRKRVMVIK
jgi:predicted NAD/FAD-binding protein